MLPSGTAWPNWLTAHALDPRLEDVVVHPVDERHVPDIRLDDLFRLAVDLEPLGWIRLGLALLDQIVERIARLRLALARGLAAVEHVAVAVVRIRVVVPPADEDQLPLVLVELLEKLDCGTCWILTSMFRLSLQLGDDVLRHDVGVVVLFVGPHPHRDLGPVLAALELGADQRSIAAAGSNFWISARAGSSRKPKTPCGTMQ